MDDHFNIQTDVVPECVYNEIETMVMCLEFGMSADVAQTHPACCLNMCDKSILDKACLWWFTESAECVSFIKRAFDLRASAVVMFAGVHMMQCRWYGVFAFADSMDEYYNGKRVWVIYYNMQYGHIFMCFNDDVGRGSYW
jgi:hypothetical protein